MAKTLQRDVNLARRLGRVGRDMLDVSLALLDPNYGTGESRALDTSLERLESALFDSLSACREYRRKVSPIEVKGQRG